MSTAGRPWSKWYWADWRSDPGLRSCSLEARGLWIEILGLMYESEPRGYLLVNGVEPAPEKLARLIGATIEEVERGLAELEREGVFSRDRQGKMFSRRMILDEKKRAAGEKFGKTGGNPRLSNQRNNSTTLKGEPKGGVNPLPPEGVNPSRARLPEARSQNSESEARKNNPPVPSGPPPPCPPDDPPAFDLAPDVTDLLGDPVAKPKRNGKAEHGTPLPTDWQPSTEDWDYARDRNFSDAQIADIADNFREYWTNRKLGTKGIHKNWHQTWQTWVRRDSPQSQPGRTGRPHRGNGRGIVAAIRANLHDPEA